MQIVSDDQSIDSTAKKQVSFRKTMLYSGTRQPLTTPGETGKDPHGKIKQSGRSLPVWWPQEMSVLVLMAWALDKKGSSPSWLNQKRSTGSSTPHPLETCSSHTDLQLERLYIPAPPGASKPYKDMENHLAKSGH